MKTIFDADNYMYDVVNNMVLDGCNYKIGKLCYADTGRAYATYEISCEQINEDLLWFLVIVESLDGNNKDVYNVSRVKSVILEQAFENARFEGEGGHAV